MGCFKHQTSARHLNTKNVTSVVDGGLGTSGDYEHTGQGHIQQSSTAPEDSQRMSRQGAQGCPLCAETGQCNLKTNCHHYHSHEKSLLLQSWGPRSRPHSILWVVIQVLLETYHGWQECGERTIVVEYLAVAPCLLVARHLHAFFPAGSPVTWITFLRDHVNSFRSDSEKCPLPEVTAFSVCLWEIARL